MTNKQVINAWVQNPDFAGKNGNGTIYSFDGIIYSYGQHFPMAAEQGGKVYVNKEKYSPTTSKHQGLLNRALAAAGIDPVLIDMMDMQKLVFEITFYRSRGGINPSLSPQNGIPQI